MKMKFVVLLVLISLLFIPQAQAGILVGQQGVTLKAGEEITVCNLWIYSTLGREANFKVNYPHLDEFVVGIEPQEFSLVGIDCPQEKEARIMCRDEECSNASSTSCRQICTTFIGPKKILPCFTELFSEEKTVPGCGFSLFPEEIVVQGGVNAVAFIGAGAVSEASDFYVKYTPQDIKPALFIVIAIISGGITVYAVYKWKKRPELFKYMYCEKCKKRYKDGKFCLNCGKELVEKEEWKK